MLPEFVDVLSVEVILMDPVLGDICVYGECLDEQSLASYVHL